MEEAVGGLHGSCEERVENARVKPRRVAAWPAASRASHGARSQDSRRLHSPQLFELGLRDCWCEMDFKGDRACSNPLELVVVFIAPLMIISALSLIEARHDVMSCHLSQTLGHKCRDYGPCNVTCIDQATGAILSKINTMLLTNVKFEDIQIEPSMTREAYCSTHCRQRTGTSLTSGHYSS